MPHNKIKVVYQPVKELTPYKNNPRKHSKEQIRQIADSIEAFGFTSPVIIDKDGIILAGHGRVMAAKKLSMKELPTVCLDHLSEADKKAYIIADNRLVENAGWDDDLLAIEFAELMQLDAGFDITVTGFKMPEIDFKVQGLDDNQPVENDDEDTLPEVQAQTIAQLGDVWQLGAHRVVCGNALEADTYKLLMQGELAQMVLTDPPYNVPIDGHVCGNGKVKHSEFAMASGEMNPQQFREFLEDSCLMMSRHSVDGSVHFIFMDWRHIADLITMGLEVYSELKNICIWNKDNGGMGSLYRSKHELVAVFKHGTAEHINNVALGRHGRYRTNVWNYRGVNTLRNGREDELAMHPTVKPVAMLADAIQDCSQRDGIILDPFGGSGSTLIAAEKTGRKARLIELEPQYVDVTIRRWEEYTGQEAINYLTGKTFAQQMVEVQND